MRNLISLSINIHLMQQIARTTVQNLVVSIPIMANGSLRIFQFDTENYCIELELESVIGTQIIGFTVNAKKEVIAMTGAVHSWTEQHAAFLQQHGFSFVAAQAFERGTMAAA